MRAGEQQMCLHAVPCDSVKLTGWRTDGELHTKRWLRVLLAAVSSVSLRNRSFAPLNKSMFWLFTLLALLFLCCCGFCVYNYSYSSPFTI